MRISRRTFTAAALAAPGWLLRGQNAAALGQSLAGPGQGGFLAGAAAVDVSPRKLPAIVNGYTFERIVGVIQDPLHARCLVLDDGAMRVAIVVVDICVMPRDLIDRAKHLAQEQTGIPVERMLVSATHTHSAASAMSALGSRADADFVEYLPGRIAEAVRLAAANLAPSQIGSIVVRDAEHTFSRRWIVRPDRPGADPFGGHDDRARMCPQYEDPDAIGPAGPVDADLSLLSVQTLQGRPLALLANYSMHYFHSAPISAGYYGRFARHIARRLDAENTANGESPVVVMMSQGTSGDQMYMDYSRPDPKWNLDGYSEAVANVAFDAYKKIEHRPEASLAMAEAVLTLRRRVPDEQRLAWARETVAAMEGRPPKTRPEIFAREQILLHESPTAELKLQALRIGDLGITAIPCEVYGITGLKIKARSPLTPTLNLSLANGAEGYIPPPEQHHLGGYSTWEARTAGLEIDAEPKIVEATLALLEEVSGEPRRMPRMAQNRYAATVRASRPAAYWPMSEFQGPQAEDCSGNDRHGTYEDGVAFHLPGPSPGRDDDSGRLRAAHFAGGRMKCTASDLGRAYSVAMWIYNGMPGDARAVAGYFFSRGVDGVAGGPGDHLGIGGLRAAPNRLIFFNGNEPGQLLAGDTHLELKRWYHVLLVRNGRAVAVHLDGSPKPDIAGEADVAESGGLEHLFFGGRSDNVANFAGKIGEVVLYDRVIVPEEVPHQV